MSDKVISVTELNAVLDENQEPGVVSMEIIPIQDLDDEQLEEIYLNNPGWVYENRPEWVREKHPEFLN